MNLGGGPVTGEKATTTSSSRTTRTSTTLQAARATEKEKAKGKAKEKERGKATAKEKARRVGKDSIKVNDYQFSKLLCLPSHHFLPRLFLSGWARALLLL